jgi:hypothetical protein
MRWSAFRIAGFAGLLACASWAHADQDYGVLIISRERLEVSTSCEIGIYMQDQLVALVQLACRRPVRAFARAAGTDAGLLAGH